MRFERALSIVACLMLALGCGAGLADPIKKAQKRHGYDFSRPEPGEILPNPSEGIGMPPQLRAYVTVKEMASDPASKRARSKDRATRAEDGDVAPAASDVSATAPSAADGSQTSQTATADTTGASDAAAAGALVTQHVRRTLAKEIMAAGLNGPFVYQPSGRADADPDVRTSETQAWNRVVASLAASWRDWQSSHPAQSGDGQGAPAGSVGIARQRAPGLILLDGAPASVTGDLMDPGP